MNLSRSLVEASHMFEHVRGDTRIGPLLKVTTLTIMTLYIYDLTGYTYGCTYGYLIDSYLYRSRVQKQLPYYN